MLIQPIASTPMDFKSYVVGYMKRKEVRKMRKDTKQMITAKVERLAIITKRKCELSSYKPGKEYLFQVMVYDKEEKGVMFTLPHWTHFNLKDFYHYLDGLEDGVGLLDAIKRNEGLGP